MNGITKENIDNLAQKNIDLTNIVLSLSEQGYVVNERKKAKLNIGTILLHLYFSVALGSKDYDDNIKHLHNKFLML